MKITGLYDIDTYIKVNDLKEVTSQAIYRSQNVFHPGGLFSEEIFGQTEFDRNYTCGYIKLPTYVFNSDVAKAIIMRSGGVIKKMAYGEVKCDVIDGVLTATKDGKYTGMKDLYNIWDEIDIKKTLSNSRSKENIDILTKSPKRLIFTNKVLVLPPNFRPTGTKNGKATKSELNSIYLHILGLKSVTAHTTSSVHQIFNKIQDSIINLYTYISKIVGGKNGFLQKHLMAKNTLWVARNVISAPKYNKDDTPIGIFNTGFPMSSVMTMFHPFIKFQMKQFLSYNNIQMIHPNKDEVKSTTISNIYDDKMIEDLIMIFKQNPGSRFMKLYLDEEKTKPIMFEYFDVTHNQKMSRPLTLTDVCYFACKTGVVDANRHVYTVRYPIGDYLGFFFTKVHVLSTGITTCIEFNGERLDYYPTIDLEASHMKVSTLFDDTITPSNSRLKQWNGDYDGDTVKSIGVWSDEANERAEKLMYSKVCCVTAQCTSIFNGISLECLSGLYALTKPSTVKYSQLVSNEKSA